MAHIILFEHDNFHGAHKHVFDQEPNLNADDDSFFNDKVSSLVVIEGNWITYDKAGLDPQHQFPPILGPGLYPWVETVGISSDQMSSLQPTDHNPTVLGAHLKNHILLFEHENFHGGVRRIQGLPGFGEYQHQHKHVFTAEPDLNAHDDDAFGVSSVAVLEGNWAFYGKPGFDLQSQYPPILGPGGYLSVGSVQIVSGQMSSLQPVDLRPTVESQLMVDQGVFLFEHASYHGAHKHVLVEELNLNADDDDFFNDRVSSFAIRDRQWIFHPDWNNQGNYIGPGSGYLIPGQYEDVREFGISNDSISSLAPFA